MGKFKPFLLAVCCQLILSVAGKAKEPPFENLAFQKPTEQISTWIEQKGYAHNAVDGNSNSNYSDDTCTHTKEAAVQPWWRVHLGSDYYRIKKVIVYTRSNKAQPNLLNNFKIYVGLDEENMTECAMYDDNNEYGKVITLDCDAVGRYVKLQMYPKKKLWLTFCELEVLGYKIPAKEPPLVNLALQKPTEQISTWIKQKGFAKNAVDGNKNSNYSSGSCTHTEEAAVQPWWRVHLGPDYYRIKKVIVYTRRDKIHIHALNKFKIYVGLDKENMKECATYDNDNHKYGEVITLDCDAVGHYVKLQVYPKKKLWLTFCELEVWGYRIPA